MALERLVKARKLAGPADKAPRPDDIDAVVLAPEEYPALLEQVYKAADLKKPRNAIGLARSLPVADMEAMLLDQVVVGEEDLRELAGRRAGSAKEWLLREGRVAAERVFIVAPRLGAADTHPQAQAGRVDFSLR